MKPWTPKSNQTNAQTPNVNALTVGVVVIANVTPHLRRRIPTNAQILNANAPLVHVEVDVPVMFRQMWFVIRVRILRLKCLEGNNILQNMKRRSRIYTYR